MNNEAVRSRDTLARVRDFATAEAALFPPATVAGQFFAEIISGLDQLDANVAAQAAGSNTAREGTEQQALTLEELLDLLMMIGGQPARWTTHIPECMQSFASHPTCLRLNCWELPNTSLRRLSL
jgi:hypothetical protein